MKSALPDSWKNHFNDAKVILPEGPSILESGPRVEDACTLDLAEKSASPFMRFLTRFNMLLTIDSYRHYIY
jgi:hypothetical protein